MKNAHPLRPVAMAIVLIHALIIHLVPKLQNVWLKNIVLFAAVLLALKEIHLLTVIHHVSVCI